jgi:hypothetical protein
MINPEFKDPPYRHDQVDNRLVSQRAWLAKPLVVFAVFRCPDLPQGESGPGNP